jgi:hypothetical protein
MLSINKEMRMRTIVSGFLTFLVAGLIFGGCGDDRSHPKDGGLSSTPTKPLSVIKLDRNATEGYTEADDGDNNNSTLYLRWFGADDKLVFDGSNSRDLDRLGDGILTYSWVVTNEDNSTMSDSCIDATPNGDKLTIKICNEANDPEEEKFSVKLTVIDDENQSSTSLVKVRLY